MRYVQVFITGIFLFLATACTSEPESKQNSQGASDIRVFTSRTVSGQPIETLTQHAHYQVQGFDVWEIGTRIWVKQVAPVEDLANFMRIRINQNTYPPRMTFGAAIFYCAQVHLTGALFGEALRLRVPSIDDWIAFRQSMGMSSAVPLAGGLQDYVPQIFPDLHQQFWTSTFASHSNGSQSYSFDGRTGSIELVDATNALAVICVMDQDRSVIHSP